MSNQGSDNRLSIFEFNTFISPGSVSYLQLRQVKSKTGAWVPLKSLSQGTQGLWNIYTVTKNTNHIFDASIKNDNPFILKKNTSETHFFSRIPAYVSR